MGLMKRFILLLIILLPVNVAGQDMILLKDKTTISARVVEEDKETVTYLIQENGTRTLEQLDKGKVKKVKYEKTPKSVNVIIIQHEALSNEHLLNDLINHMIMSGYTIEEFDNDYYTVSTPWISNKRINAQIVEHEAFLRCFHRESDKSVYPNANAKVTWGIKPKPDEKRGSPGSSAFKDLNALCRSYLKNGMATIKYRTEDIQ
jgi:hypothetical protein